MKWTVRIIKHLAMYLLILLPLEVLGMIILFPILLFVGREAKELPFIFRWFQNATLDGIDGALWYRIESKTLAVNKPSKLRLTYFRYKWIAFRNPLNFFQYHYTGVDLRLLPYKYKHTGPVDVGDLDNAGLRTTEVTVYSSHDPVTAKSREYWEFYWIYAYKVPFRDQPLCIRMRLGWKFSDEVDAKLTQWTMTVNPVMPFRGKYE